MGSVIKICLPIQKLGVQSLVGEDLLEKEVATHFSILAWEIPYRGMDDSTEKPGGPQSMELQKSETSLSDSTTKKSAIPTTKDIKLGVKNSNNSVFT